MASYYRDGKSWTVTYRRGDEKRRYIYGIKSEAMAKAAAEKKRQEEQLVRAGLAQVDPAAEKRAAAAEKPIEEFVARWHKSILELGRDPQHAMQQAQAVRRLLRLARIESLSGIEPVSIQAAAAELMQEPLSLSPRTANAGIKAMRQFSTWLFAKAEVLAADVLHRRLSIYNEAVDQRRRRRAMLQEEYEWLMRYLAQGRDKGNRCGISRRDRIWLYRVGLGTGFRRKALLSLTTISFHVAPRLERPYIALEARSNKGKVMREQPIRRDLADGLHEWLKGKGPGPVWALRRHAELALRFRRDLEGARELWIAAAADDQEREERAEHASFLQYEYDDGRGTVFLDFHGLRHTGITWVVRDAGLRVGQAWAGHSTPVLTARYAHMDLPDELKALEALPKTPNEGQTERQPVTLRQSKASEGTTRHRRKIG